MRIVLTGLRVLAIVWIALLVACCGFTGLVLCTDADGRMAVVAGHGGHCGAHDAENHGGAKGSATGVGALHDVDCCGTCVDVPLFSPFAVENAKVRGDAMSSLERDVSRAHPIADAYALKPIPSCRALRARIAPTRISAALLERGTIVLRI